MLIHTLLAITAGACLGLLGSFLADIWLQPRPRAPWRRPVAALLAHVGIWGCAYALELVLWRRPVLATINVVGLYAILFVVNNAKMATLREPFIYPDFEYFLDALRHPRLYLPFLQPLLVLGAVGTYLGITLVALRFEPRLPLGWLDASFWLVILALAAIGAVATLVSFHGLPDPEFDAADDVRRLGLLASLLAYRRAERQPLHIEPQRLPIIGKRENRNDELPTLIAVQSESFFDVRRWIGPRVDPSILAEFDRFRAESRSYGRLQVPAWGANTVRSEFAFLAGMGASDLGVHQFNPYRQLRSAKVVSLASRLRDAGYRTVCIHPYAAEFYSRNVVFPNLGFEQFIDGREFSRIDNQGPYVGDVAVAERIRQVLASADGRPMFIYAITMENHGPLHLEPVSHHDFDRFFTEPLPPECNDLIAYVRHLANADRMLSSLRQTLQCLPREAWLCWFGDHVPAMNDVYARLGAPDGTTDYFVWHSSRAAGREGHMDRRVEDLAAYWLHAIQNSR